MNLSEALDAALPEIPKSRIGRNTPPRLDPDLIVREDVLDGETVFGILQRGRANYFRFQPAQWKLAQLFDGSRSFEEIASLFASETGVFIAPEDVRFFAENMEENDFWYKTPQEKNLALSEKLTAQRGRRAQRKSRLNIAHITFSAWDPTAISPGSTAVSEDSSTAVGASSPPSCSSSLKPPSSSPSGNF